MALSKHGYLLKQEFEEDARWEDARKLYHSGKVKEATALIYQIRLSWGMSFDGKIELIRGNST